MKQLVEYAWESLNKDGEELCGDCVKVIATPTSFNVVLSDGLGSGVKANILATLTAQIAGSMFQQEAGIGEVMETLIETLPECRVRKLAYATFAMLRVWHGRDAYLVEYDSPPLILVRDGQVQKLPIVEKVVHGRQVRETHFELQDGDYMTLVSDGYEHAGVSPLNPLGWGWENIATSVRRWTQTGCDAYELVAALTKTCRKLYNGQPGDDATAVGMRVRQATRVTILTGPPSDNALDKMAVSRLVNAEGQKVVCGGTTAQIVARVLGKELKVEVAHAQHRGASVSHKHEAPSMGKIEGIDLVTEGILTLGQTIGLLEKASSIHDLPPGNDGASRLAHILLQCDEIHLLVGAATNPNQIADLVRGESLRQVYVKQLVRELERHTKTVTIEYI
jgi:hypothetical protein